MKSICTFPLWNPRSQTAAASRERALGEIRHEATQAECIFLVMRGYTPAKEMPKYPHFVNTGTGKIASRPVTQTKRLKAGILVEIRDW